MLEHLKDQYVTIAIWDRESPDYDTVGGGINSGNPQFVVTLLDVDEHWVEFQWKHSGQVVAVHASDVVCIATDLPKGRQERGSEQEAEGPPGSDGWNLFADMLARIKKRTDEEVK